MRSNGGLAPGRAVEVGRSGGIVGYLEGGVVFEGFAVEWDEGVG